MQFYGRRTAAIATFGKVGRHRVTTLCFIDEAGDLGSLSDPPQPNDQPVLVIGGLFVDGASVHPLTDDFLNLKKTFSRSRGPSSRHLDRILHEIKGATVRKHALRSTLRARNHAIGLLDGTLRLVHTHNVKLVARIWVKGIGAPFDARSVYTSSVQTLCTYFHHAPDAANGSGMCIADGHSTLRNVTVAHSIFTKKFGTRHPCYQWLAELPTFGHSVNHAGLQICDIVCSALLYPIACFAYCTGHVTNIHVQPGAARLRKPGSESVTGHSCSVSSPDTRRHQRAAIRADWSSVMPSDIRPVPACSLDYRASRIAAACRRPL